MHACVRVCTFGQQDDAQHDCPHVPSHHIAGQAPRAAHITWFTVKRNIDINIIFTSKNLKHFLITQLLGKYS